MKTRAVFHYAPRQVEVRNLEIAPTTTDQVLIKSRYSAISAGTEAMIFTGNFPEGAPLDTTLGSLAARFTYPFRYGYIMTGVIVDKTTNVDGEWIGRQVFAFHPHQDYAWVSLNECLEIPDAITPLDSLFFPNMETSVNFVLDANPRLGENIAVFGVGVVGLLSTTLLSKFPLNRLIAIEPLQYRRQLATQWGATEAVDPTDSQTWYDFVKSLSRKRDNGPDTDTVLELSGNPQALNQAIEITRFDGTIIAGSWYGTKPSSLNLAEHFHRRRLHLVSSQVSTLNPRISGRWPRPRRRATAWEWIEKLRPQSLITHRLPLEKCQDAYTIASQASDNSMQIIFEYPE